MMGLWLFLLLLLRTECLLPSGDYRIWIDDRETAMVYRVEWSGEKLLLNHRDMWKGVGLIAKRTNNCVMVTWSNYDDIITTQILFIVDGELRGRGYSGTEKERVWHQESYRRIGN